MLLQTGQAGIISFTLSSLSLGEESPVLANVLCGSYHVQWLKGNAASVNTSTF